MLREIDGYNLITRDQILVTQFTVIFYILYKLILANTHTY